MMKYACNHPYKFKDPTRAYIAALFMFVSAIFIETANLILICCTEDTLSIVSNFVSIVIVAEFDNYVFLSLKNEPLVKLVDKEFTEKLLVV